MSYPSDFSRLHLCDEGSQGVARGEDSVRSREGEGLPSTSSKDVPSHVDSARVITWLKLVGKPGLTRFGRNFPFPAMFRSRLCTQDLVLRSIPTRIGVE